MKPYLPEPLPLASLDWEKLIHLIGKANFELARYEGILQGIANPAIFLSPLTTQEAVLSSKIEGTEATLEEVLQYEALPKPEKKAAGGIKAKIATWIGTNPTLTITDLEDYISGEGEYADPNRPKELAERYSFALEIGKASYDLGVASIEV